MKLNDDLAINPPLQLDGGDFDLETDRLIFMHFEKTGGTTVRRCLSKLYENDRICPSQGSDIKFWPHNRLRTYEFIACHANISDFRFVPRPRKMITFLRDPVDRCLSLFNFWSSYRSDYIEANALPFPRLAKALGIRRLFAESHYDQCGFLWNRYAEGLSGHRLISQTGERWRDREEVYDTALNNLEGLLFVGITENMSESFRKLSKELHARNFYRGHMENVTDRNHTVDSVMFAPERPSYDFDAEVIDAVEHANDLDRRIYRHCAERFFGKPEATWKVRCVNGHEIAPLMLDTHGDEIGWARNRSAGFLTFGPGSKLSRGDYTVTFKVRNLSEARSGTDDIGFVDVAYDAGTRIAAQAPIRQVDWASSDEHAVTVSFRVMNFESTVEFRTFANPGFSFEACLDVEIAKRL